MSGNGSNGSEADFGSMVMKMAGAKFYADFLEKAWEGMSEEQKKTISDAACEQALKVIGSSTDRYSLDRMISSKMHEIVLPFIKTEIENKQEAFQNAVKKCVEENLERMVRDLVSASVKSALTEVQKKVLYGS